MQTRSKSSFISWWLEGLKLLIPDRFSNLFNPSKKPILMQLQSDDLFVIWPQEKNRSAKINQPGAQRYQLNIATDREKLTKQLAGFRNDKYDIVLCMPAHTGLAKIISLPLSAEAELASIIGFEIERQTPFNRDQVYSGYRITAKGKENLDVELNVIPKKQVNAQLSKLHENAIRPQAVELLTDNDEPGIDVLPGSHRQTVDKTTQTVNQLLALISVLLLGLAIGLPYVNQEKMIDETEVQISQARTEAQEITQLRQQWETAQGKQDLVNQKIEEHRPVTLILDELTRLIPDNTWLNRLYIKGESVQIQGESSSPTQLISLIENSDQFTGTRFQSPVTSNASSGKDRFQITTLIENSEAESIE